MAYKIGTVTGSSLNDSASGHKMLFNALRTFLETELPVGQRWVPQRTIADTAGVAITSITRSGTTATVNTGLFPHKLTTGDTVTVSGASDSLYNGVFIITVVDPYNFTYVMLNTPAANASGTLVFTMNSYEVIWKAPGLSGLEEIFCGIKTYQSATSDYYNFKLGCFTGYIPNNTFETQAGSSNIMGATLWNQSIDYWFVGNGQRCLVMVKIADVYESFGFGKELPYATPSQFPYPAFIFASMPTPALTRYSDTTLVSGWKGSRANFQIRTAAGAWVSPDASPYNSTHVLRNTASLSSSAVGYYGLHSIVLSDSAPNVYGELEGIYYISGFNNATENTIIYGGITYIVFRDRRSVGVKDFLAVRMQ